MLNAPSNCKAATELIALEVTRPSSSVLPPLLSSHKRLTPDGGEKDISNLQYNLQKHYQFLQWLLEILVIVLNVFVPITN